MLKRLAPVALLIVAGCGGGGGGGSAAPEPLRLHFSQNPLSGTYYQWDISPSDPPAILPVGVSVTGSTTATTFYLFITDLNATFRSGQIDYIQTGPSSFHVDLPLVDSLALGAHNGTLNAKVCSDPGCADVLLTQDQAYRVTVRQNPTLTISSTAPLVGKALAANAGDPVVAGFHVPTLTFQGVNQLPAEFRSPIYLRSADPAGRVAIRPWVGSVPWAFLESIPVGGTFQRDFMTTAQPGAGNYAGTLTFQVCRDPDCNDVFSGISTLDYQLSVAASNPTALTPVAGAPDWTTEYGNPARTSYVPITVDTNAFAPRWLSAVARSVAYNYSTDVLTSGDRVFVTREGDQAESTNLYALNESDGSIAWQKTYPGGTLSPMLVNNGKVYLETAVYNTDAILRAHAAADGTDLFAQQTTSHYAGSPLVALGSNLLIADRVDGPNGYMQHFNRYDGETGALLGQPSCLQPTEWQAANNNGYAMHTRVPTAGEVAYFQMASGLEIVDFGAGQSCTNRAFGNLAAFATAAALGPSGHLVYTQAHCSSDVLVSKDTLSFAGWQVGTSNCVTHNAAIAGGVVYAMDGDSLTARNETTGALLWQVELFHSFGVRGGSVLVTDNMALVLAGRVFAVDLATKKVVWTLSPLSLPYGAWALSSSGVLYLIDRPGYPSTAWSLVAVNLR